MKYFCYLCGNNRKTADAMSGVKPKKALGQHFLTDLSVAQRIAATLDGYMAEPVLEIGPGMGVLTQFLLERHGADRLTVVELDSESVQWLQAHLPEPRPRIVEGDFLAIYVPKSVCISLYIFTSDGGHCTPF